MARNRETFDENRSAANRSPQIDVRTNGPNTVEQFPQISCNSDFVNWKYDLAVLNPEARCASRVVSADHVDALPE